MESDMAQSDLTVRIDDDLKASGEAFFRSKGISWSTAISAFVSYSIKQGKIPFDIDNEPEPPGFEYSAELEAQDPFFNRATQVEIVRRIRDVEAKGEDSLIDFDPTIEQKVNV